MFWHSSREKHGFRAWLHFGNGRRHQISTEVRWWATFCHVGVEVDDDEGWQFRLAVPPLAVWITLEIGLWVPKVKHIFSWDNNREVWLTDRREFNAAIHSWTLWLTPWGRSGEWRRDDPWWVRGVSFNTQDFVLGRRRYSRELLGPPFDVSIPMPEGMYRAVFSRQRQTWKRPRWFALVRDSFDIEIPKGIPFAGKGENSYDCGDDGLFGTSAEGTLQEAITRVHDSVMESRRRYGSPSSKSITQARVGG